MQPEISSLRYTENSKTKNSKDRVSANPISSFLTEVFNALRANHVDYAVARDYPTLPERLEGRDLDIVVGYGELERAYNVVKAAAKVFSAFVLRIEQEYSLFLLVVHSDYNWALRIDLNLPNSNTWRGCCIVNLESALKNKISVRGIDKFRNKDIFLMQFCRDILFRLHLREKYHSPIRKLYLADSVRFKKTLEENYGVRCAARLVSVCSQGNFYDLKSIGKQMRRAVMVKSFIRHPARTIQNMVRYVYWRCREYIKPNGLMISVLGPAWTERKILVESVQRELAKLLQYQVRVFHSKSQLFPNANRSLAGRVGKDHLYTSSGDQIATGNLVVYLRLFGYILNFTVGYWITIRHYLGRKYIAVIYDDCLYDYRLELTHFLSRLLKRMINFVSVLMPQPDVSIFLSAEAAAIKKRKPGLTAEETRRQVQVIEEFTSKFKNFIRIDTSGDMIITEQVMRQTILQKLKENFG